MLNYCKMLRQQGNLIKLKQQIYFYSEITKLLNMTLNITLKIKLNYII